MSWRSPKAGWHSALGSQSAALRYFGKGPPPAGARFLNDVRFGAQHQSTGTARLGPWTSRIAAHRVAASLGPPEERQGGVFVDEVLATCASSPDVRFQAMPKPAPMAEMGGVC